MERPDIHFERPYVLVSSAPEKLPPLLVIGVRPYVFESPEAGGPETRGWAMLRCGSDLGWTIRSVLAIPEPEGRVLIPDAKRTNAQGQPVVWTLTPLTLATLDQYAKLHHVVGYEQLRASVTTDNDLQNYYYHQFLSAYWREQWEREQADPRYR
jgi:hypothetical protein